MVELLHQYQLERLSRNRYNNTKKEITGCQQYSIQNQNASIHQTTPHKQRATKQKQQSRDRLGTDTNNVVGLNQIVWNPHISLNHLDSLL